MRFKLIFLAFLVAIVVFPAMPKETAAYPGGLLNGKPGLMGGREYMQLTDNDETTRHGWYSNSMIWTLENNADITSIRGYGSTNSGAISANFYDGADRLVGSSVGFASGNNTKTVDFKSVKKVELRVNYNSGSSAYISEFDIFGSYQLAQPRELKATAGIKSIDVSWVPAEGATGYVIYLNGVASKSVGAGVSETTITGLNADSTYSVRVSAKHGEIESAMTEAVTAKPMNDLIVPVLRTEKLTWNEVVVGWTLGNTVDAQFVDVYLNGSYRGRSQSSTTRIDALPETTYTFRVAMVDKYGRSVSSGDYTVTTPAKPIDTEPPGKPENFKGQQSGDRKSIGLGWTKGGEEDLAGYNIYVKIDGNYTKINSSLVTRNSLTYDKDIEIGKTYEFRLEASDTTGNISEPVYTTVEVTPIPITESDQQETNDFLLVTWTETPEAVGYKIYFNGSLVGTVGADVFEFKVTREMGYRPGAIKNSAEVKAIFADGSEGGSNNPGGNNLADVPFVIGGMIDVAIGWLGIFSNWIIIGLSIIFAVIVIQVLFYVMKNKHHKRTVVKRR